MVINYLIKYGSNSCSVVLPQGSMNSRVEVPLPESTSQPLASVSFLGYYLTMGNTDPRESPGRDTNDGKPFYGSLMLPENRFDVLLFGIVIK